MSAPYGLMADLHLHAWSSFSTTLPDGQNSRLVGLLGEIRRCAQEVKDAGGKVIVMAGDVFHVRGSIAPSVLNAARDELDGISAEFDIEFVIIPGNHDLEGKEATRLSSAVTALGLGRRVSVVNAPTRLNTLRIALVPWVEKIDELKATIERLGEGEKDTFWRGNTDLIIHAPIDGVIKGLPTHGLTPEWLAERGFKRVFAGHYHNHKLMYDSGCGGATDTDVYSIGALAHHTWSDIGTKAGYLMVYPDRVEYRKSHLPEFIDLNQLVDVPPEEIAFVVDQNYVRVKVEASKAKDIDKARQDLLDMGAKAVLVQASPKPPAREGTAHITVSTGASLEVSVVEYAVAAREALGAHRKEAAEEIAKAALGILAIVDTTEA